MKSYEKFITYIIYTKTNSFFMTLDFLTRGLDESRRIAAIRRAFDTVKKRQKKNMNRIPDLKEKKARLRRAREEGVGNEELLNTAIQNLRENGFRVYLANTAEDAISRIKTELGGENMVVKAKSNTAKEIDLAFELESWGVEVVETDIGDRILQISNESPTHPTGPIAHLDKTDIAKHASRYFEKDIPPEAEEIVEIIKDDISGHIKKANISITGANSIAAEEGAVLLIHNEGNILEVMMRTGKHMIITGTDKIYRNLDEAVNAGTLQTFFATGSLVPSFMNVIGGPSKTADIEKQLIKGVHGPKEIVIILLDNKRSEVIQKGFGELLYCIGCGACLLHCPVYNFVGDKFANGNKLGGKGIVHSAVLDEGETDGLLYCVTCARCRENCPVELDIPEMMKNLREEHSKSNAFLESHLRLVKAAARFEIFLLLSKVLRHRPQ